MLFFVAYASGGQEPLELAKGEWLVDYYAGTSDLLGAHEVETGHELQVLSSDKRNVFVMPLPQCSPVAAFFPPRGGGIARFGHQGTCLTPPTKCPFEVSLVDTGWHRFQGSSKCLPMPLIFPEEHGVLALLWAGFPF